MSKNANVDEVVSDLLKANAMYLNPKIVKKRQLTRLVEKLLINLGKTVDKENNDFKAN